MGEMTKYAKRNGLLLTLPSEIFHWTQRLERGGTCYGMPCGAIPRLLLFGRDTELITAAAKCVEALDGEPFRAQDASELHANWPRFLRRICPLNVWKDGRVLFPKWLALLAGLPWETKSDAVVCGLGPSLIEVYSIESFLREDAGFRQMDEEEQMALQRTFSQQTGVSGRQPSL